jgi:N-acyl amino acid synthase of PEP-CTERM/exosortase system
MFVFKEVRTEEELEQVFRLRFQVYCIEREFEDPDDYPDGIERDEYDDHAWHYLCLDGEGRAVGTARLIRPPDPLSFPIELHCRIDDPLDRAIRHRTGEISRLAVSKGYRRRAGDTIYGLTDESREEEAREDRRRMPILFMGLLRELYQTSLREGITHWYAAMERKLAILTRRYCFDFQPVGPEIDYHGRRIPHAACIASMAERVRTKRPDIYRFFHEDPDTEDAAESLRLLTRS